MAISAEELRRKLAEEEEAKNFRDFAEPPAEGSGDSSNSAQSARQGSDSAREQKGVPCHPCVDGQRKEPLR